MGKPLSFELFLNFSKQALTTQNMFDVFQRKNPGTTGKVIKVVGGAQKELINKMLKSSSESASVTAAGSGSAPNILRGSGIVSGGSSGSGAGVTAVAFPATALMAATSKQSSPKPLQQSAVRLPNYYFLLSPSDNKQTLDNRLIPDCMK